MSTLAALIASAALAGAPSPQVSLLADGTLIASLTVPATEARVRAVLDDPVAAARLSPDVLSAEVVQQESDDCSRIHMKTRGMLRPLELLARRCRKEHGYTEELVASEDFLAWEAEWKLQAVGESTEISVSSRAVVDLPVPDKAIHSRQKRSVGSMLSRLVDLVR